MLKKWVALFMIFLLTFTANAKSLIPGGESAGVYLKYDGVLVTGSYAFFVQDEQINLNKGKFQSGDLIYQCYEKKIETTDDLISSIQSCLNNNLPILMTTKTKDGFKDIELDVYFDEASQSFKTGLYITDHITAIGTITYYDPETQTFGAFGHSIEADNECLSFDASELFEAYISSIEKNTSSATGKKIGTIEKTKRIGNITQNSELGLFGNYQTIYKDDLTLLETAKPSVGEAVIYTTLTDNQTKAYTIYIEEISDNISKSILFKVTDETLLNQTNGIVPGMSGSPIIQNGKIVGAVTHVLVNNPTKGYGIFIENMLDVAG